jgi:uncharacterized protein (DUF433 family)
MGTNVTVAALTEEHITRITGLSKGQLRAWDRRGFFVPRYAYSDRSSAYSRIYSFRDAVGLKTIAVLRFKHKLAFKTLLEVARELTARGFDHWADTKLYVLMKKVYFQHPGTDKVEGVEDGQFAMLPVIDVLDDVREKVSLLNQRDQSQIGATERNKFVSHNTLVFAGTRIPVAAVQRYLKAGFTKEHIIKEYPTLTFEDIQAAEVVGETLAKVA